MSMTQTITYTHRGAGGTLTKTISITAEAESRQDLAFASDAAAFHIETFIPVATIKAISFLSDQDVTLNFNDSGGTNGALVLTANVPVYWYEGAAHTYASIMGFAAAAVDITDFYLTNDGSPAAAGTLKILALYDPTP